MRRLKQDEIFKNHDTKSRWRETMIKLSYQMRKTSAEIINQNNIDKAEIINQNNIDKAEIINNQIQTKSELIQKQKELSIQLQYAINSDEKTEIPKCFFDDCDNTPCYFVEYDPKMLLCLFHSMQSNSFGNIKPISQIE